MYIFSKTLICNNFKSGSKIIGYMGYPAIRDLLPPEIDLP